MLSRRWRSVQIEEQLMEQEQNSWFCSKNGMIILYWFGFYLLLAFFTRFFAPIVAQPDMHTNYIKLWFPLFNFLGTEGVLEFIRNILIGVCIFDLVIMTRLFEEFDEIWFKLRLGLMIIAILPYFCMFVLYSHRFIERLVLTYLPRATD